MHKDLKAKYYPNQSILEAGPKKLHHTHCKVYLMVSRLLKGDVFEELGMENLLIFGGIHGLPLVQIEKI